MLSEAQVQLFFTVFSLLSVVSVLAVHFFIRQKLGNRHDSGLLWFSAALFVWFLMGLLEYCYSAHWPAFPPGSEQYWRGRKVLSIFNSALFVYSLSYFRDAWLHLNKRLEHLNAGTMAAITMAACFATFPLSSQIWQFTETVVSILVATLLCGSMMVIFWQRGIPLMIAFTLLTWCCLTYTQLAELCKELNFSAPCCEYFKKDDLPVRMLSRPSLVVCILVLAISWLGTQLEEEVVARTPGDSHMNMLRFERRGTRHFITMSLQTETIAFKNVVFDFSGRTSSYVFLTRCAEKTAAGENFRRDDFTGNFETTIKRLLEPLNQKLSDENLKITLQKSDLYVSEGNGLYRLVFAPQEITLPS